MNLYDPSSKNPNEPFGTLEYEEGEPVYEVAWRADLEVLEHRGVNKEDLPSKPEPSLVRLAFPPST